MSRGIGIESRVRKVRSSTTNLKGYRREHRGGVGTVIAFVEDTFPLKVVVVWDRNGMSERVAVNKLEHCEVWPFTL